MIVDIEDRPAIDSYTNDKVERVRKALALIDLTRNNGYKFFPYYDPGDTPAIWKNWLMNNRRRLSSHPKVITIVEDFLRSSRSTRRGGAYTDSVRGPDELPDILEEQEAWNKANDAYNSLEPEYKTLLPPPSESLGPAPLSSLATPFQNYINNEADPEALEEARDALGMIPPEEVEDYINNDESENEAQGNAVSQRVTPMYQSALPGVKPEWVTIMIRADILQQLLQNKMATVDGIRQI